MSLTQVSYSMVSSAPFSVLDYGADPTGATDSAPAILAAFAAVKANGGGVIDFPNNDLGGTYLISYGFRIPNNCTVRLNGCTLRATTTYAQGTIPTEGYTAFFTFGRPTSESPLPANTGNSSILGGNAIFQMRRNEQTGTVPGYMGVELKTTDVPQQVDHLKLKNIVVRDLTINYSGFDGVYVQGVQNALFENIITNYALRIGFTGISGDTVTFNDCQARLTVGSNPNVPANNRGPANSGEGFWNEPDFTWQYMNKWQYNGCRAELNYQSGFKPWNAGADAQFGIVLNDCYSYSNVYDATVPALRSSPGFAQFEVTLNDTSSNACYVIMNNCIADTGLDGGFIFNKGTGAGKNVRIVLNECVVTNCNISNTVSINRAPIHALTSAGLPAIIVNNPTIIAPTPNTSGYGIYFAETTNVQVTAPVFVGTFTVEFLNAPLYAEVDLTGSTPSIATLDVETGTVTVAGAALGDFVSMSSTVNLSNSFVLSAKVSAADTVTYGIYNVSGGSVTRIATRLCVRVNQNPSN
jgi:hypothetical protein